MYQVIISPRAQRFFEDAIGSLQRKLDRCFNQLKIDPRSHNNIKALTGPYKGYHRYRVGDYRVIYLIDDAAATVHVEMIAHRSAAYE